MICESLVQERATSIWLAAREGRRCARNGVPIAATAWMDELLDIRGKGIARRLPSLHRLLEDAIRDISEILGIPVDAHATEVR
ncbi:hypothetical protein [Mesorhizobium sp. B2-8-9]|uniref:hypothetical protein n=1 Tax=Mesorhizobium sp. B2-8-9 TaxID=2589899 RepID=UPI0011282DA7|nr:hypothetical protein [Mesorhizobium sp. B2-8-9]TPI86397.1 hypothetical protein FJ423_00820 [Mesorhizobium sp. B2-8-9]